MLRNLILLILLAAAAGADGPAAASPELPAAPAGTALATPAEIQIRAAEVRIKAGEADAGSYSSLAVGLTRRARETGDPSFYDRALEALAAGRRLEPRNPEIDKISAWVRMGRHEFARARRIARRLAADHPEDDWILGVLGDSLMELGRYDEAERAYQAMIDLRPGPSSYCRASHLLEVRGNLPGALELMTMALGALGRSDREDRAWLRVQIGHLHEALGDPRRAEASYRAALDSFPGYHDALAALAGSALRRGLASEAEALATAAIAAAPHAERYLLLADALRALGREKEARAAEDRFEALAAANSVGADNENHDLVLYYLERRGDHARALEIARREARVRRDIHTLDRLAWALHHDGKARRARRLVERILATGTRDPLILDHAREIRSPAPRRAADPGV